MSENDNLGDKNFIFMQLPPEVQAMIEHHQMHAESTAHDAVAFFEALDEQQLRVLRGVIGLIQGDESAAAYYMGLLGGLMSSKFGVCLGCSKKHDEELAKMAHPIGEPRAAQDTPTKSYVDRQTMPESKAARDGDRRALMADYNLRENGHGQVSCLGCGQAYISLEDRMLRNPEKDGCDGCVQKEKWG